MSQLKPNTMSNMFDHTSPKARKLSKHAALLSAVAMSLALSGCASNISLLKAFRPDPVKPIATDMPSGVGSESITQVKDEQWWKLLPDPLLAQVIETALENNTSVKLAQERLNEAGALLGVAKTAQWPAIFGQYTFSRNRPTRAGNTPVFGNRSVYENNQFGLGASWELDIWGRLGSMEDVAQAQFLQQAYNLRGVRLSIAATTATLYTQARILALQVNVLEETARTRQEAYDLALKRQEVGLINELALRQTESELLGVQAQLPDARENLAKTLNALDVLTGGKTPSLPALVPEQLQLRKTFIIAEDVSSELLLRRPDLAAAEQQMIAADANLDVARKAFLPTISLTGFGGRESAELSDLFSGPAKIWNFRTQITQPIWQAGRLFDERDAAVAKRNQAVLQYEAAIRTAFQEVYDAIVAQREARERLKARAQQVAALQEVYRLAKLRVEGGVASQLELLDAQRNLLSAQLAWSSAFGQQQAATLAMVRSLGGGFQVNPES